VKQWRVISFTNLVNKSSVTPFKKVHKSMGKEQIKRILDYTKDKAQQQMMKS
jgi:hypothetical protein